MSIADIGRAHLKNALTGKLEHCTVNEWIDDNGNPVEIYWKPLTGAQQKQVDEAGTDVERTCMMLKVRALDADHREIFADVPLAGLVHDYDFSVIRTIVFLMVSGMGQENRAEAFEKE